MRLESTELATVILFLDPFVGSGTTLVECKLNGIQSFGVDANDFLVFASRVKINWEIDTAKVRSESQSIMRDVANLVARTLYKTEPISVAEGDGKMSLMQEELDVSTNELIRPYYISPTPLAKLIILKKRIEQVTGDKEVRDVFRLALASVVLPSSNIRYGPGFGITKPKTDVDVLRLFRDKIERIVQDLTYVEKLDKKADASVVLGDTRHLDDVLKGKKFDYVITSPPYPGDHEYTQQTRLELAFLDFARSQDEVRIIKKRMLRGSTRNLYSTDKEFEVVEQFPEIVDLMKKIKARVKETNGTSGFEKLYSRVIGEYFGGMYTSLQKIYDSLEAGGNAALLVGDSHAFKMTHVETARLLGLVGKKVGFDHDIELWWNKTSTAHKFFLPEYILNLKKN